MTDKELNDLKQKRAKAVADARSIHERSLKEKREFNTEEQSQYDTLMNEQSAHTKTIQREENLRRLAAEDAKIENRDLTESPRRGAETPETESDVDPEQRTQAQLLMERRGSKEYRAAYSKYLTRGRMALTPAEHRDLSSDSDADGGYLVMPTQMATELLKNVDDEVYIRSKARKFTLVSAKSLGAIKRTAKLSTFAWGGEVTPPTKDTSLKFGKRELNPHYLSGLALVSRDLLMNGTMAPATIVNNELVRDGGEVQERAFISGTGAGQPLGVFTASNDGISTGRDISTDNTTTAVTFDGLINAKFALKPQYRKTAEWMFHRDCVKMISKLKDAENRYIWEPSKVAGEPDRILALPYVESEWVPNTFTTGQYVGILANWNYYWIADALDIQIQRLVELYALSNQDGFVARLKTDGMPQIEEAFARVKLG